MQGDDRSTRPSQIGRRMVDPLGDWRARLLERAAVVSGAGSGLGAALSDRFADAGMAIVSVDDRPADSAPMLKGRAEDYEGRLESQKPAG